MKQTVGVDLICERKNWQDKACNVDIDVGLRCAAEAHSPPPSRLPTEEVEEDEEEEMCFYCGPRDMKSPRALRDAAAEVPGQLLLNSLCEVMIPMEPLRSPLKKLFVQLAQKIQP
ncbi:hypothetical protein Q5P01_013793 [Channa striata]|uniref:Uncharacterized protein n=1 Tax=Channa striata TaxID=64152 RepID=A0AA88MJZ0_CHASR|nr:hypothetical protein Q5P01_013793 [Channa striata]